MRKLFKRLVLFIPSMLIIYILLLVIWGYVSPLNFNLVRYTQGSTLPRMEEAKHTKDVDILILGASHTFKDFDPRLFEAHGYSAFILGSSNQSHIQTYMLLQRYLDRLNPSVVLYETSADLFGIDGVESACDLVYNDVIDGYTLEMIRNTDPTNIKLVNTFLFSSVHQLFGIDYHKTDNNSNTGSEQYIKGGYIADTVRHYQPVTYPDSMRWEFKDKQLEYFEKAIDYLKERGDIKIFLVQAPIAPCFYSVHENNKEFDKLMLSYGNYHNFNELLQLNDSIYFYDETHLNQLGADVFTNALIEMLSSSAPSR